MLTEGGRGVEANPQPGLLPLLFLPKRLQPLGDFSDSLEEPGRERPRDGWDAAVSSC